MQSRKAADPKPTAGFGASSPGCFKVRGLKIGESLGKKAERNTSGKTQIASAKT